MSHSNEALLSPGARPAPSKPALEPGRQGTPKRANWAANVFRVRGWKTNVAKHTELQQGLDAAGASLLAAGGADSAAALAAEKLDPGTEFKAYMKCLAAFEQSHDATSAAALGDAAAAYIKHYNGHSSSQQAQKKTLRKFQACQKAMADLDKWAQTQNFPRPPWDSKTALRAAALKAETDFASLPMGEQTAKKLDATSANPTFWVNKAGADPGRPEKTYLFKPTTSKQDRKGVPPGGEPAREALTGRAADVLGGMTGIDFKVPDTHIVAVGRERFDGIALGGEVVDAGGTGPLVGSLQQFAQSQGELRQNPPSVARAVPAERCQELAILDIITLHVDRHAGNFMVGGEAGSPDLVPIDNGLSFPETAGDISYMGAAHNALLRMPGAHKKFTPEMLQKIAKINPDALKAALQKEVGDIEGVHASAKGKVGDPALEQSRRSAIFLKMAAPLLTPAAVQIALGQNAELLFPDKPLGDIGFKARATRVIAAMAAQQDEQADYFKMPQMEQIKVEAACKALGWEPKDLSPVQLLKVYKSGVRKPAAPAAPAAGASGPATDQEKADMQAAFPWAKPSDGWFNRSIAGWRELAAFGTPDVVKAAVLAAASKATDAQGKQATLNGPAGACRVLKEQAAADLLPAPDPKAGAALMMDMKLDMIREVTKLLAADKQAAVLKRADTLRAGGHKDALEAFFDQVIGPAQTELLRRLEAMKAQAALLTTEKNLRAFVLKELMAPERMIRSEMNLLDGSALLDELEAKHLKP